MAGFVPNSADPNPNNTARPSNQFASRNVGSSIPGVGLLQSLLGREGQPNLPPINEVPVRVLLEEQERARAANDVERVRAIRDIIESRSQNFVPPNAGAPPSGPQGSTQQTPGLGSFKVINQLLGPQQQR